MSKTEVCVIETKSTYKEDVDFMKEVFSIQSYSHQEEMMVAYVENKLSNHKDITWIKDVHGNILITKGALNNGEYYPCLAAHLDTVHPIKSSYEIIEETLYNKKILRAISENKLEFKFKKDRDYLDSILKTKIIDELEKIHEDDDDFWEFLWNLEERGYINISQDYSIIENYNINKKTYTGGVGDDKGGIWLALDLLAKFDKIKVALFSNEEVGTIGSNRVNLEWFKDCAYIIQGDRKNSGDIIHDRMCSQEFIDDLEYIGLDFGFKSAVGLYTDVTTLVDRGVGISCVNISVGYYNPHMPDEYTVINELINSRDFVQKTIKALGFEKYEYVQEPMRYSKKNGFNEYDDWYSEFNYGNYDYEDEYCEEHIADWNDYVIDAHCSKCNPISKNSKVFLCEECGSEMEERKYSRNCTVCGTVKIKTNANF
jgi:putative aminopeptidase FrvX